MNCQPNSLSADGHLCATGSGTGAYPPPAATSRAYRSAVRAAHRRNSGSSYVAIDEHDRVHRLILARCAKPASVREVGQERRHISAAQLARRTPATRAIPVKLQEAPDAAPPPPPSALAVSCLSTLTDTEVNVKEEIGDSTSAAHYHARHRPCHRMMMMCAGDVSLVVMPQQARHPLRLINGSPWSLVMLVIAISAMGVYHWRRSLGSILSPVLQRLSDSQILWFEFTLFAVLPAVLVGLTLMLVRLLRRRRERRGFEVRAKDVAARVEAQPAAGEDCGGGILRLQPSVARRRRGRL